MKVKARELATLCQVFIHLRIENEVRVYRPDDYEDEYQSVGNYDPSQQVGGIRRWAKPIANKSKRRTAFRKRVKGLRKKLRELAILTDVHVQLLIEGEHEDVYGPDMEQHECRRVQTPCAPSKSIYASSPVSHVYSQVVAGQQVGIPLVHFGPSSVLLTPPSLPMSQCPPLPPSSCASPSSAPSLPQGPSLYPLPSPAPSVPAPTTSTFVTAFTWPSPRPALDPWNHPSPFLSLGPSPGTRSDAGCGGRLVDRMLHVEPAGLLSANPSLDAALQLPLQLLGWDSTHKQSIGLVEGSRKEVLLRGREQLLACPTDPLLSSLCQSPPSSYPSPPSSCSSPFMSPRSSPSPLPSPLPSPFADDIGDTSGTPTSQDKLANYFLSPDCVLWKGD